VGSYDDYDDHDDIDALRGWVERLEALHRAIDQRVSPRLLARLVGDDGFDPSDLVEHVVILHDAAEQADELRGRVAALEAELATLRARAVPEGPEGEVTEARREAGATLIHATPALLDGWCGPGVDDKGGGLIIDGESQTVHDLAGRGYDYQWYGEVALIRLGWDDVSPILLDLARPEVQDRVCRVLCARGAGIRFVQGAVGVAGAGEVVLVSEAGIWPGCPVILPALATCTDLPEALAWFRWMPGMLAVDEHGRRWRVDAGPQDDWCGSYRPVLTDPATLGCLVGLLREVSGDAGAHTERIRASGRWIAWWVLDRVVECRRGDTEIAALWGALDAAWTMRGGA
jgi:hypothetical protein